MMLSCLPVSLYRDLAAGRLSLAEWFRLAGALGLDGADVSMAHVPRAPDSALAVLRRKASDAGVQIAILAAYSDFVDPTVDLSRAVDDVRRWIEMAATLGATFLRLTAGQDRAGVSEAEGLDRVVEGLHACVEAADGSGVEVLFENHVRGAIWSQNDFTQPVSRFLEVVVRTRRTGLRVLFDTANSLALGDEPEAVLTAVSGRVGAVHVSDIARRGTFEPTTIGTGVAPIPALLGQIVRSGFDGWVSIEEASNEGAAAFGPAVGWVDRAWIAAGGRPRRSFRRSVS